MPLSARAVICCCLIAVFGAAACRRQTTQEAEAQPPVPVIAEPVRIGDIRGVVSATGVVVSLPGADFVATAPQPAGRPPFARPLTASWPSACIIPATWLAIHRTMRFCGLWIHVRSR